MFEQDDTPTTNTDNNDVFVSPDTDNLDDFQKLLDGSAKPAQETEEPEEVVEDSEDDIEEEGDDPQEDVEDVEDEDDEPSQTEQKPVSKFQKRINELREKQRLADEKAERAEARAADLERRLIELEPQKKEVTPKVEAKAESAPDPDAIGEDGKPLYPLGDLDPHYIRDATRFDIEREFQKRDEETRAAQEAAKASEAQQKLVEGWEQKLKKVEETLPDVRQKTQSLAQAFDGVTEEYGDFLATTIMSLDNGPEIMYYLSDNMAEAQRIVTSGPVNAVIALGRISAKIEGPSSPPEKKVSKAPTPPVTNTRGNSVRPAFKPDTDNLDEFSRELFKKRKY